MVIGWNHLRLTENPESLNLQLLKDDANALNPSVSIYIIGTENDNELSHPMGSSAFLEANAIRKAWNTQPHSKQTNIALRTMFGPRGGPSCVAVTVTMLSGTLQFEHVRSMPTPSSRLEPIDKYHSALFDNMQAGSEEDRMSLPRQPFLPRLEFEALLEDSNVINFAYFIRVDESVNMQRMRLNVLIDSGERFYVLCLHGRIGGVLNIATHTCWELCESAQNEFNVAAYLKVVEKHKYTAKDTTPDRIIQQYSLNKLCL